MKTTGIGGLIVAAMIAAASFAVAPTKSPAQTGVAGAPQSAEDEATPVLGLRLGQKSIRFSVGDRNVKALLPDGQNTWIGTSGGVIKYMLKEKKNIVYDNRRGLLSNGIFYLGKIRGEIWVGTYGGGLSILDTGTEQWRNYNIPQGMADAFVYDVLEARSGDVWIATWSGANRVLQGNLDKFEDWLVYTVANTEGGLPNDWVYGLAEGKNGEIWMATEGGLARFMDGHWDNWGHADGLGASYEQVKADTQFDKDPGKYSDHHASQKQEQGLQNVDTAYNPNYIVAIVVDDDGSVWVGTWGAGLSHFDGKTWRTFTVKDGLPANHVFSLAKDPNGRIWVGTSRGIASIEDGGFRRLTAADGLFSDNVFSIEFADSGAAWVGSLGGIAWFPQGLN